MAAGLEMKKKQGGLGTAEQPNAPAEGHNGILSTRRSGVHLIGAPKILTGRTTSR
jgi:hypothetical protein